MSMKSLGKGAVGDRLLKHWGAGSKRADGEESEEKPEGVGETALALVEAGVCL